VGISVGSPTLYGFAGRRVPASARGRMVAAVFGIAYVGLLGGPGLVGQLADLFTLRWAIGALAVVALLLGAAPSHCAAGPRSPPAGRRRSSITAVTWQRAHTGVRVTEQGIIGGGVLVWSRSQDEGATWIPTGTARRRRESGCADRAHQSLRLIEPPARIDVAGADRLQPSVDPSPEGDLVGGTAPGTSRRT
jgi:MFS family permease